MSKQTKVAVGNEVMKGVARKPRFIFVIEWRELNVKAVIAHFDEIQACAMYSSIKPYSVNMIAVTLEEPGIILTGTP